MIGESGTSKQKVQYHYYKCTGRKRKLNDCKKHTVRQDYLEDLIFRQTCDAFVVTLLLNLF